MSVLKNLRKISRYEFEYHYSKFYEEYKEKVDSLPKRKTKLVGKPLLIAMNNAHNSILRVNQYLFTKKEYRKEERDKLIIKAINDVYAIQNPLFTYWNVEKTPRKKQARWCYYLDREIDLLNNLLDSDKKMEYKFIIIDWNKSKTIEFIHNMLELHRTLHSKLIKAVDGCDNTETPILAELIDTALYETLCINKIYPTTAEEYLDREYKIDSVLTLIDSMAIPLCSYFSLMKYSESEQRKIITLIETEEKLLNGLKKSDVKQFSYLLKNN
jgi:hypothetical protein